MSTSLIQYLFAIIQGTKKAHVFLLLFVVSVVATLHPSYTILSSGLPVISKLEKNIGLIIDEVYPEELTITIKDGKASTNVTEPYYLTVSQQTLATFLPEKFEEQGPISKIRLLAIDTNARAEDFDHYQSLALLTSTSLVYQSDKETKIQSLSSTPDIAITKEFINKKLAEINKGNRVITFATVFLYVSPVLILVGLYLYYLIEVLIGAFLIWLMNKILQTGIPFTKIFQLTGILYLIPALLLIAVRYIPGITIFYTWFYTALDVAILSGAYVLLKQYKRSLP